MTNGAALSLIDTSTTLGLTPPHFLSSHPLRLGSRSSSSTLRGTHRALARAASCHIHVLAMFGRRKMAGCRPLLSANAPTPKLPTSPAPLAMILSPPPHRPLWIPSMRPCAHRGPHGALHVPYMLELFISVPASSALSRFWCLLSGGVRNRHERAERQDSLCHAGTRASATPPFPHRQFKSANVSGGGGTTVSSSSTHPCMQACR